MLTAFQLTAYTATFAIAAAIPGPGMITVLARSVGGHAGIGFAVLVGIIIGDLTYLSFAVFGLSAIAHAFTHVYFYIQLLAGLYLLYLAWQFWGAGYQQLNLNEGDAQQSLWTAGSSGLLVTLSNPKAIAFYMALLPALVDLNQINWQSWAFALVPITVLVLVGVGAVYIFTAMGMKRFLAHQFGQLVMYRGAAVIMLLVAISMLYKIAFQ